MKMDERGTCLAFARCILPLLTFLWVISHFIKMNHLQMLARLKLTMVELWVCPGVIYMQTLRKMLGVFAK